ncbi:MAG: O-antigen ligase family protein [Chloroflexi bacterium]|nr:O-antigen ligase family protein [Chloroflexota bacterium]
MAISNNFDRRITWALTALAMGLLVMSMPMSLSVMVIGLAGALILILIEPALAIIAMLALAPLKTLIETEVGWGLPADIGQLSLAVAIGAWALQKMIRRDRLWPIRLPSFIPTLGLFLLVTGFSIPNAYSIGAGLSEWLKWLEIGILIVVVADFAERRWEWLVFGVILAAAIQAVIGIWEFRGGSGAAHLWIADFRYFRAFGTFGQPNPFGAFMGLVLPLSLGMMWGYLGQAIKERRLWKAELSLYAALSIILLAGLLVSWSRGAWMGFGAAVVVMVWLLPKHRRNGTLTVAAAGIGFWLARLLGLVPATITVRILSFTEDFSGFGDMRGVVITDENFAVVERLAHWQAALDMAAARPWLGVGFGNYEAAYLDFNLVNWTLALGHAHNYYLNLLAEVGIIGLLSYLLLWGHVIILTWYMIHQANGVERGVAIGLMGVWTHLAVHSLVDKLYVNNLFLHVGVMLGILAVLQHRIDTNRVP